MKRLMPVLLLVAACAPQKERAFALQNVSITLPEDTTTLPPGPNVDLVTANCTACHSSEMILTQPRLTRKQWESNVEKMVKIYGASIEPADMPMIVDYLVTTNARLTPQSKTAPLRP